MMVMDNTVEMVTLGPSLLGNLILQSSSHHFRSSFWMAKNVNVHAADNYLSSPDVPLACGARPGCTYSLLLGCYTRHAVHLSIVAHECLLKNFGVRVKTMATIECNRCLHRDAALTAYP